jgi:glycosyltransferase involved in cell wall biosynthesis
LILFIGNLVPRKRVDDLLQAMPHVLRQVPQAMLFVAGSGPLREALSRMKDGLQIADRVLLPGAIPHDDLPALLNSSELFVLPSAEEGMGMVLLEAMASGRPVVASRNSGILSVIDEGQNGVLFETGNVADLSAAVTRVLMDTSLSMQLAENARQKALERFDRNKQVEELLHLYEASIRKQGSAGKASCEPV